MKHSKRVGRIALSVFLFLLVLTGLSLFTDASEFMTMLMQMTVWAFAGGILVYSVVALIEWVAFRRKAD